jgi:sec-independent protein translocase protein TatA
MPGLPELLIILFVVILVFGVGRISNVAGELGRSIHEFRKGLSGEDDPDKIKKPDDPNQKP